MQTVKQALGKDPSVAFGKPCISSKGCGQMRQGIKRELRLTYTPFSSFTQGSRNNKFHDCLWIINKRHSFDLMVSCSGVRTINRVSLTSPPFHHLQHLVQTLCTSPNRMD